MIWVILENPPATAVTKYAHAHTLQWGEVQQANSIHTKAPLILFGQRFGSQSEKPKIVFYGIPHQHRGGENILICFPHLIIEHFNRKKCFGVISDKSANHLLFL